MVQVSSCKLSYLPAYGMPCFYSRFQPDSTEVILIAADWRKMHYVDVTTLSVPDLREKKQYIVHGPSFSAVGGYEVSADGRWMVAIANDQAAVFSLKQRDQASYTYQLSISQPFQVMFHPYLALIAILETAQSPPQHPICSLIIKRLDDAGVDRRGPLTEGLMCSMTWSTSGHLIALYKRPRIGTSEGEVTVVSTETWAELLTVACKSIPSAPVPSIAISQTGLLAISNKESLAVFSLSGTEEPVCKHRKLKASSAHVAFSPAGNFLAFAAQTHGFYFFDTKALAKEVFRDKELNAYSTFDAAGEHVLTEVYGADRKIAVINFA